jgi:hypothetical protein
MVTNCTPSSGTGYTVLARDVTGNAANHGALDAALGVRLNRKRGHQQRGTHSKNSAHKKIFFQALW